NLVDFVDIDDAALGALDIIVGRLQQLEDDVLDVLADIARFGERGGVGHGEWHIQNARQGLRQQGLAAAGGADQHDIGFGEFDVAVFARAVDALIVIVDGDREHLLGVALADDIVVQNFENLLRGRHTLLGFHEGGLVLLPDDFHAELDAFVADKDRRAGDEFANLVLALAAERAIERVFGFAAAGLTHLASGPSTGGLLPASQLRASPVLLCTMPEEPKHPHLPTFDHVSGDGIKICLIRSKCRKFQELSLFLAPQGAASPSGLRLITWSNSPKLLASSAVI